MKENPYRIAPPAIISFSGGRTSGFMLRKILDAYDGRLPAGIVVCFANTGKERPETLDFVNDCSEHWNVPIVWLEYADSDVAQDRWRMVDYDDASRNGEPFAALIKRKNYLPNPVTRFCTIELKIRTMKLYAQQVLQWKHWTNVVGLRADEPHRVGKARIKHDVWENALPLADDDVCEEDVMEFWSEQPFDLKLKSHQGNCDLCFLKGTNKRIDLVRDDPQSVEWWIEQERLIGATFRKDGLNYTGIKLFAERQATVPFSTSDDQQKCETTCTD